MGLELKVPAVGESVTEVEIGEWLKQEGDHVEKDENLVVIETDKATVEVPAPESGRLSRILKKQGEPATVGEVIGEVEPGDGGKKAEGKPAASTQSSREPQALSEVEGRPASGVRSGTGVPPVQSERPVAVNGRDARSTIQRKPDPPRVMPAARRLLDEQGISADAVTPSGPGGRILKEDVVAHAAAAKPAAVPHAPGPSPREEELVPMSLLRRKIAERLVAAQHDAALLTTFNEFDMSAVVALRKQYQDRFQERYNIKLGFMSFFVKASCEALKEIPQLNAEIRDKSIAYRNYYDIGVAIGGGRGLVVPVLRNAERMSFAEIELAIAEFAQRVKENKLRPEDLQGGTFTITNGGVYGSLLSTPIINPPQSGVLGMHAIQDRPVAVDGQVVIRPMMYVALTYDHRVVDGREAVTFLRLLKEVVEKPARMLIEV